MKVALHGENVTKAKTLPELFNELQVCIAHNKEHENGAAAADLDFWPIDLPRAAEADTDEKWQELVAIRTAIREKLCQLFIASLSAVTAKADNRSIVRDYQPTPGHPVPYFDADDLEAGVWQSVERALDPEDECFDNAVADVKYGVLQEMGDVLNFIMRYGDPRCAVKYLQRFTRPHRAQDGQEIPLSQLAWEKDEDQPEQQGHFRVDVLKQRQRERMAAGYRADNKEFADRLLEKFVAQERFLKALFGTFQGVCDRLHCNEYQAAKWFNVLVKALMGVPAMTTEIYQAISIFGGIGGFTAVRSRNELANAVEEFVEKTLPPLIAKAKTEGETAAAATMPVVPAAQGAAAAPAATKE